MPVDVNGIILSGGSTFAMSNGSTNIMAVSAGGVISRPQTPYVRMKTSAQGPYYHPSGNMVFGSVDQQVGSNWNNSTGVWTCPVAGYYLATMNFIGANSNGVAYGYPVIQKNGGTYCFSHWNINGSWDTCGLSAVIQCNANDTISFQLTAGNGVYGEGNHCFYGIALLG